MYKKAPGTLNIKTIHSGGRREFGRAAARRLLRRRVGKAAAYSPVPSEGGAGILGVDGGTELRGRRARCRGAITMAGTREFLIVRAAGAGVAGVVVGVGFIGGRPRRGS